VARSTPRILPLQKRIRTLANCETDDKTKVEAEKMTRCAICKEYMGMGSIEELICVFCFAEIDIVRVVP